MQSKMLTSSLCALAVMGQVPDLREGDCVRARAKIEYENMPDVLEGHRGMVTGKGIAWEGRDWSFGPTGEDGEVWFKQRNAVIHRSMVEKMSETEGYGPIRDANDKCLTVFDLGQSEQVQWWPCQAGWTDQQFILPACGVGPGQIRWAKDPQKCFHINPNMAGKLVLSECEWSQPFIFSIVDQSDKTSHPENADISKPRMLLGGDADGTLVCIRIMSDSFAIPDMIGIVEYTALGNVASGEHCGKSVFLDGLWSVAQNMDASEDEGYGDEF